MISIVITAFKEPTTIGQAIESALNQQGDSEYEVIVACPDPETKAVVEKYQALDSRVKHFHDPGKGKSFALNLLFKKLKGDILVFTDGDVYLNDVAIQEIERAFIDPKVGCVGGRVISQNSRASMLGYWAHLLADVGAHRIRQELASKNEFFECSGYLFAIRNNVIEDIPLDVAEDAIIPWYFHKKGYKLKYVPQAQVFVKNPNKFGDWIKQRKRTAGAHTKLTQYEPDLPKVKSLRNEVRKGAFAVWTYPRDLKEVSWTVTLMGARLYMWSSLKYDEQVKSKFYNDGWDRVESTK